MEMLSTNTMQYGAALWGFVTSVPGSFWRRVEPRDITRLVCERLPGTQKTGQSEQIIRANQIAGAQPFSLYARWFLMHGTGCISPTVGRHFSHLGR